jgi:small ligand-binding sensory domain FIST
MFARSRHILKPSKHARSYWTQLTTTGHSIDECVQTSLDFLKRKKPSVCVALVSKSFSLKHYQTLLTSLNQNLQPALLVGGVIDRVPQFDHGISLLLGYDETIKPFTIKDSQDRLKIRNTSVGRWGRVDEKERTRYQNDFIESGYWKTTDNSVSTPAQPFQLPPGLEEKPSFVFIVSDNEPDQLLQTLDHHYPDTPKVGIVGASTPFVTGMPYTLFRSEEILDGGIVGFASYEEKQLPIKTSHGAIEPLGDPMKITNCKGNVILDLGDNGATGLLLKLIQNSDNYRKDEEFYLSVYPLDQEVTEENATISRITSGDPSRGNMSIDTTADLQPGQTVQVSHYLLYCF